MSVRKPGVTSKFHRRARARRRRARGPVVDRAGGVTQRLPGAPTLPTHQPRSEQSVGKEQPNGPPGPDDLPHLDENPNLQGRDDYEDQEQQRGHLSPPVTRGGVLPDGAGPTDRSLPKR